MIRNYSKDYHRVFIVVAFWFVSINIFAALGLNRFNLTTDTAYSWIPSASYSQGQEDGIVGLHSRWDSNWYFDVAEKGYHRQENDTLSNVVFFPLYPFLLKLFSFITSADLMLSGWIISSIFLLLSALYFYKLVLNFHKEANPILAVLFMLIFPTSFFLNAVYTESLFLFLSIAAFYHIKNRDYWIAGILGLLAALTRVTGILLFIPLVWYIFEDFGLNMKALKRSLVLLLIPLGTFSFVIFHWLRFGDPLLFFRVQSAWGRSFNINFDHFMIATRASAVNLILDISYLVFIAVCIFVFLRRRNWPYFLYMASTVFIAVSTGTLMSIGRYILVLFPIYILGASIKDELARYLWVSISILLLAMNTLAFVNWYWAG